MDALALTNQPTSASLGQGIEQFKHHLNQLGFVSPVYGTLQPSKIIPQVTSRQEVFGLILEGDLALSADGQTTHYLAGELFFIDKVTRFELKAGPAGTKYLFAFK
jgi:ethanolamine utilization protein EutQ (cupin superfamily)